MRISDWSSDVCSSDLLPQALNTNARYSVEKLAIVCGPITRRGSLSPTLTDWNAGETPSRFDRIQSWRIRSTSEKIGRASCRERVCKYVWISVGDGYIKKKKKTE